MPEAPPVNETRPRRRELLVIVLLSVVLLATLGVLWLQQRGVFGTSAVVTLAPGDLPDKPVELNAATWWELKAIPGISENLAKQIIVERDKRGGFKTFEELDGIPGIGEKRLEAIRAHVCLEPPKKKEWQR